MDREMRFSSLAVRGLFLIWVLIFAPITFALSAQMISGAEVNALISDRLSSEGLTSAPNLNAARQFKACAETLSITPLYGSWKTVSVRCPSEAGWQIAVRTKAHSENLVKREKPMTTRTNLAVTPKTKVGKTIMVASLSRSVQRNEVIRPEDVSLIEISAAQAIGVFPHPSDVIGRRAKQSISAKKPIYARQLKTNWMIEAGQEVAIEVAMGSVSVSVLGVAEENGQYRDWIKVRNKSSQEIISGQIIGPKNISVFR